MDRCDGNTKGGGNTKCHKYGLNNLVFLLYAEIYFGSFFRTGVFICCFEVIKTDVANQHL